MPTLESLRPLLFSIAYKMTGNVMESEDIVQDVFLNYTERSPQGIEDLQKYLSKATINKSLDYLKQKKKIAYIGPDLPEPWIDSSRTIEVQHDVSIGTVRLLLQLNPSERAAYILREVFDFDYAELSEVLQQTEANCRQLFHRAKEKMQESKRKNIDLKEIPKFQKILSEALTGKLDSLVSYMQEDIIVYADGGGKVKSAINPIFGKEFVTRYLVGVQHKNEGLFEYRSVTCNGAPAVIAIHKESKAIIHVAILEISEGLIENIYIVSNPDKLKTLSGSVPL